MSARAQQAAAWIYRGIWAVLVDLFKVPDQPPTLPVAAGESVDSFRPAEGFLRYLKFWFWIVLLLIDIALTVGTIAAVVGLIVADLWWLAVPLIPVALFIIIVPDIFAYIAIHLRYDTTWYVMTDRSLRIRRGVMVIHEVTITFENVQNISVRQGPVQRHFGIANVMVQTAGGGGGQQGKGGTSSGHEGVIEGIANAPQVRDRILARLRESRSAGLGDEERAHHAPTIAAPRWTAAHLDALRQVREEVRLIAAG